MRDIEWGSFLEDGPWELSADPTWLRTVQDAQRQSRERAKAWIVRRRIPPVRVIKVAAVLAFSVGGWWLRGRNRPESAEVLARRLVVGMERLGPAFVKLAQIISAGEGVFPEQLVVECKRLRDAAQAEAFDRIQRRVEQDLGCSMSGMFTSFTATPIAAASIAQVHEAVLADGTPVVVKVRRSGIERIVERDIRALAWLAPFLVGRLPHAALANPPALVELFAETIIEELDFRIEGASMLRVARALAAQGRRGVVVPRPHPTMVTAAVLVQEQIVGMTLSDVKTSGVDGEGVVQGLLSCVLEGALIEGIFHGDLHAGNMFVLPDGRIALIDFGITAKLSEGERLSFARLVTAGMSGDWRGQLRALQGLGALPADADLELLGRELGLDQPVDVVSLGAEELARELQRLSRTLLGSGAKLPKSLMLWAKNVVFIDAAIGELAPECDVLSVLGEVALGFVARHGSQLTREIGEAVTVSDAAIRTSIGIDAATGSMTWNELQSRRKLIASRARHALR